MNRRTRITIMALTLAAAFAFALPATAAASYTVENVALDYLLDASGYASVIETRTLDVSGSYDYFYWWMDEDSYDSIEVVGVYRSDGSPYTRTDNPGSLVSQPAGFYYVDRADGALRLFVFGKVQNSTATYVVHWRFGGLVQRYVDGAVFGESFPGDWGAPTKLLRLRVTPPSSVSRTSVTARTTDLPGGSTTVDTQGRTTITGTDVPNTSVARTRIVYPASLFPGVAQSSGRSSLTRSPSASSLSYTRRVGRARFTLKAKLTGPAGRPVPRARVYLQTSANGTTGWRNAYALTTGSTGYASKTITVLTKRTLYYRWYAPPRAGAYTSSVTPRQKVVVR